MNSIYYDDPMPDDARRRQLYSGQLFVFAPRPSTLALCKFAVEMSEQAFSPHDPRHAQDQLPPEQFSQILAELKPDFIHHPRSKELIRDVIDDLGCDLEQTFFDVPRLRTATSGDYLSSGMAYAFKPHRDTWYSTPLCQLNWWLPVYDITPDNAMAFHPAYWNRPIKNSSHEFNYQDWQQNGRKQAASQIGKDTRRQSEALEPLELDPQLRLVVPAGGLILFSAAQFHSTVPNSSGYTRLSVDFRTVHLHELADNSGAPNVDSACSGTTIRDYLRGTDFAHIPEDTINFYEQATAPQQADGTKAVLA